VKLFKNRRWFFDGRLHPFNTKESVDILKNHVRPLDMRTVGNVSTSKIQDFMEDYEQNMGETYDINEERIMKPITGEQLTNDFNKQMDISLSKKSIMEMFQEASNQLANTSWEVGEAEPDDFNFDSQELTGFVLALGENKQRRKKEFYTITNLKLNQSFVLRVLDLFFKNSNIMAEDKTDLPDYGIHCLNKLDELKDEGQVHLISELFTYIVNRISILTGTDVDRIATTLRSMKIRKRTDYNTLKRLTKYSDDGEQSLYDLLFEDSDQGSDSEGDFD